MNDATAVTATTATKKTAEVETVTMTDTRLVEFPGKKVLQKESFEKDGAVYVRLDFRNGETRTVKLRDDMLRKYAAHGAEQKLGDEIAGLKKEDGSEADTDDKVLVIDALIERLDAGEWTTKRDSSGMAGTSVLLRAIVEVTGKPLEAVKGFLKDKTQAQKLALRDSAKFRDTVARIEAEKASKKAKIDISADLAELDALA
jgi:hypothetical protein